MALSGADLRRWNAAQRRAALHAADLRPEILKAFKSIQDSLTPAQLSQYIRSGGLERIFSDAELDRAFAGSHTSLLEAVQQDVKFFSRDITDTLKLSASFAASFNVLDPRVVDAIRKLDTRVFGPLKSDMRELLRKAVERGLQEGKNPTAIARTLKGALGLAPNQWDAVQNYRDELERGSKDALNRQLRDRRFDGLVGRTSDEQIDRMVGAYERRFIAFNAETNARTATLDAMKLGQNLSWQDAIAKGIVDEQSLMKRWVGVKDSRERPSHLAMEGQTVPFASAFSNGQMIPGDDEYNCRCIAVYFEGDPTSASAKGLENDRLEKMGLPADSPERRKARRDERNRLRREAVTNGASLVPTTPTVAPIPYAPSVESSETALQFKSDPTGAEVWRRMSNEERQLLAKQETMFQANHPAIGTDYGTFFPGNQFLSESRSYTTNLITYQKYYSVGRTAEDVLGTAAHETSHAIDWAWGQRTEAWGPSSQFFSTSREGLEFRQALMKDMEEVTPISYATEDYKMLLKTGYQLKASTLKAALIDEPTFKIEAMADLIASVRFNTKIRGRWTAEQLKRMFPRASQVVADLLKTQTRRALA